MILANQPGDQSWPMTAATCILLYKKPQDAAATAEALKFFAWAYAKGDKMAEELDYVPMPDKVVERHPEDVVGRDQGRGRQAPVLADQLNATMGAERVRSARPLRLRFIRGTAGDEGTMDVRGA